MSEPKTARELVDNMMGNVTLTLGYPSTATWDEQLRREWAAKADRYVTARLAEAAERFCVECLKGSDAPCNHIENGRHCKWYAAIMGDRVVEAGKATKPDRMTDAEETAASWGYAEPTDNRAKLRDDIQAAIDRAVKAEHDKAKTLTYVMECCRVICINFKLKGGNAPNLLESINRSLDRALDLYRARRPEPCQTDASDASFERGYMLGVKTEQVLPRQTTWDVEALRRAAIAGFKSAYWRGAADHCDKTHSDTNAEFVSHELACALLARKGETK